MGVWVIRCQPLTNNTLATMAPQLQTCIGFVHPGHTTSGRCAILCGGWKPASASAAATRGAAARSSGQCAKSASRTSFSGTWRLGRHGLNRAYLSQNAGHLAPARCRGLTHSSTGASLGLHSLFCPPSLCHHLRLSLLPFDESMRSLSGILESDHARCAPRAGSLRVPNRASL